MLKKKKVKKNDEQILKKDHVFQNVCGWYEKI